MSGVGRRPGRRGSVKRKSSKRGRRKTPAQAPAPPIDLSGLAEGGLAEAVRLLRTARNSPEAFKKILDAWLSQLGVPPPEGVLTPWRRKLGRRRKPEIDLIVATWVALGRPYLSRQNLARAVYAEDFATADVRQRRRLVNRCRRAVERRIPFAQSPRPI